MKEYVIPVAFEFSTEDDTFTEADAASWLATALAGSHLAGLKISEASMIDSWWMPNHPQADGSDREAVLMWVPLISYAGRVTEGETPQQSVNKFMDIMATWSKPQDG